MYAIIRNDHIFQIFDENPKLGGNLEVKQVPDNAAVGWVRDGSTFVAPLDVELAAPPIPEVTKAQAKIQLFRAGFLLPVQESVKALGGEVEIWFNDAGIWQRNNPHVNEIGAGLNLTSDEIDDLFRQAALIDA